jgi:DHA2 family multidrug resistance protein
MALLPPFLQNLMGYPVLKVGYLLPPRGVGVMVSMFVVGRLIGRVDARLLIFVGLSLTSFSLWEMTLFNTEVTGWDVVRTGIVQGLGLGLLFVPISSVAFATLAPRYRNEGTALFSLVRNIGSSIGISIVFAYLSQRTQINHAAFSEYINSFSLPLRNAVEQGVYSLNTETGLMALNAEVTRQAAILAYLQDFRLMMWVTLAAMPLLLLLKSNRRSAEPAQVIMD